LALAMQPDSPLVSAASFRPRAIVAFELLTLGALIAAHLLVFRHGDFAWTAAVNAIATAFPNFYRFNTIVAFAICSLALLSLRFIRATWFRWPVFVLMLWIAYGSVPTAMPIAGVPHVREDFALTVSAHRFIGQHLDLNRPLRTWYMIAAGEQRPFRNISSTYLWGWALVNEAMPALESSQAATLAPTTQLVSLVADHAQMDAARQALRRFGLDYTVEVERQFGAGDSTFWVVIGGVSRIAQFPSDVR